MFNFIDRIKWNRSYKKLVIITFNKDYRVFTYAEEEIELFLDAVYALSRGEMNNIDFDEDYYLDANPDVKLGVENGSFPCGYIHYLLHGHLESRPYSSKLIQRLFNIKPQFGKELFKPTPFYSMHYEPDLSNLDVHSSKKTLLIFIPYLKKELFFAGYTAFFNDINTIFPLFDEVNICVSNLDVDSSLLYEYGTNINVDTYSNLKLTKYRPDLIYSFDSETFHQAIDVFSDKGDIIYYCQDDEAGFHPFGTLFVRSRKANILAKNCVFSTKMLFDYFSDNGFIDKIGNYHISAPKIDIIEQHRIKVSSKRKKIFFYYRPEAFNSRNLDRMIADAIFRLSKESVEFDAFLVGGVETSFSQRFVNINVTVINKLPKEKYFELLMSCDLCVAMIYSAHPGVIAYQAAASGIPTITNTFSNRNETFLKKLSSNLIPYNPVSDSLAETILHSIDIPKGNGNFNYELYSGLNFNSCSFNDYNLNILKSKLVGSDKWLK
jgi:O-antigen biosynthesis protein